MDWQIPLPRPLTNIEAHAVSVLARVNVDIEQLEGELEDTSTPPTMASSAEVQVRYGPTQDPNTSPIPKNSDVRRSSRTLKRRRIE